MADLTIPLDPQAGVFLASAFPQYTQANGTAFPVPGLSYDASTAESAFWTFLPPAYSSGGTVLIQWYADTASTGAVVWGAGLAAITPATDTQDVETKALAAETTATTSHAGTTGQRLHSTSITVGALDSMAAGDYLALRIRRVATDGSDTMAGDTILVQATFTCTVP